MSLEIVALVTKTKRIYPSEFIFYSHFIILHFFKRFVPVLVLVVFVLEASGVPSEAAFEAASGVASETDELDTPVAAAVAAEPYSSYS